MKTIIFLASAVFCAAQSNEKIAKEVSHELAFLIGAVTNEADKNIAGAAANGVLGVAKVDNKLRVEK